MFPLRMYVVLRSIVLSIVVPITLLLPFDHLLLFSILGIFLAEQQYDGQLLMIVNLFRQFIRLIIVLHIGCFKSKFDPPSNWSLRMPDGVSDTNGRGMTSSPTLPRSGRADGRTIDVDSGVRGVRGVRVFGHE
jgi:hypothetical protein